MHEAWPPTEYVPAAHAEPAAVVEAHAEPAGQTVQAGDFRRAYVPAGQICAALSVRGHRDPAGQSVHAVASAKANVPAYGMVRHARQSSARGKRRNNERIREKKRK